MHVGEGGWGGGDEREETSEDESGEEDGGDDACHLGGTARFRNMGSTGNKILEKRQSKDESKLSNE